MTQPEQPQAVEHVFGELRSGYENLESYVAETFDRIMKLELEALSAGDTPTNEAWQQEKESLTQQLQSNQEAIEELRANVSANEVAWLAEKANLTSELDEARKANEELKATLEGKDAELVERQAAWDQELSGLREMIEAKLSAGPDDSNSDDAVLNSVLNQFANLKK